VRAAAVDALTKIAVKCSALRNDILTLLQCGQNDNDDEVRDRISLYSGVLSKAVEQESNSQYLGSLVSADMPFSMDALYDGLLNHISSESKDEEFVLENLPTAEAYQAQLKAQVALSESSTKKTPAPGAAPPVVDAAKQVAEAKAATNEALNKLIQELDGDFGPLQHSTKPKYITETEAEYTVQVIKHMFKQHLVLELSVSNTVQGVKLENIGAKLSGYNAQFTHVADTSIVNLDYGQQASAYVVLAKKDDSVQSVSIKAALRFIVKEDGDDLGYDDDYPIENVNIGVGDYLNPKGMPPGQFKSVWEQMASNGLETQKDMSLNFKSIDAAVEGIIQNLNMQPCENTGKIEAGAKGHTLLMTGVFVGGNTTLVKAMVRFHEEKGLLARIACRSRSQFVCDVVAKAML